MNSTCIALLGAIVFAVARSSIQAQSGGDGFVNSSALRGGNYYSETIAVTPETTTRFRVWIRDACGLYIAETFYSDALSARPSRESAEAPRIFEEVFREDDRIYRRVRPRLPGSSSSCWRTSMSMAAGPTTALPRLQLDQSLFDERTNSGLHYIELDSADTDGTPLKMSVFVDSEAGFIIHQTNYHEGRVVYVFNVYSNADFSLINQYREDVRVNGLCSNAPAINDLMLKGGSIGMLISPTNRGALIRHVTPNSPAAQIGLMTGMVVTAVDGASIEGLALSEIIARIRGQPGTKVSLDIEDGDGPPRSYIMKRIEIPSVRADPQGIGVDSMKGGLRSGDAMRE